MSMRYSFQLEAGDPRRKLPHKLLLTRSLTDSSVPVLLRLLGYLLFFRERLQVGADLHDDNIPFVPDLVQLDYTLRPVLWVECSQPSVERLHRLAAKAPEAELWVLCPSVTSAEDLVHGMAKAGLRRGRYHVLGFDGEMMNELLQLLEPRNHLFWSSGTFDPPNLQFEFNGLWFDHEFVVLGF